MLQPLRVLLIEDSVDDAELLLHELRHGGYDVHWQRVETADALRTALMDPWDVVISDYTLPEFSAMQALGLVKEHDRDLPFIITSETVGEETAVAAMKAGAHDYIVKGHWARLVPAIARELSEARVRRERKQAQKELEAYARNLILLNDITRAASGILDFNQMLQVLADRLGELLDADGCFLTLWDEKKQAPIPAAAYGSLRNSYAEVAVEQDEATLTGHVLKTGKVLAIEDTEKTPYLSLRLAAMFPSRAILALPLIVAEQKLGAALISFDKPYIFSQDEISRGEQAAGQIALAVAKAQLLDAERKQRDAGSPGNCW
jgi:DNA-binding response OmpR family regulator